MAEKVLITEIKALTAELVDKSADGKLSVFDIVGTVDNFLKIYQSVGQDDDVVSIINDIKQIIINLKAEE